MARQAVARSMHIAGRKRRLEDISAEIQVLRRELTHSILMAHHGCVEESAPDPDSSGSAPTPGSSGSVPTPAVPLQSPDVSGPVEAVTHDSASAPTGDMPPHGKNPLNYLPDGSRRPRQRAGSTSWWHSLRHQASREGWSEPQVCDHVV